MISTVGGIFSATGKLLSKTEKTILNRDRKHHERLGLFFCKFSSRRVVF